MEYLNNIIIPITGLIIAWLGFLERRLAVQRAEIMKQIENSDKLNQVVQVNLKEDIARLENKIDMLITLQINGNKYDKKD